MDLPGATVFITIVTHRRAPLFADTGAVEMLREAVRSVRAAQPFELALRLLFCRTICIG
jgi:REP element-mobilizing transposase RayT